MFFENLHDIATQLVPDNGRIIIIVNLGHIFKVAIKACSRQSPRTLIPHRPWHSFEPERLCLSGTYGIKVVQEIHVRVIASHVGHSRRLRHVVFQEWLRVLDLGDYLRYLLLKRCGLNMPYRCIKLLLRMDVLRQLLLCKLLLILNRKLLLILLKLLLTKLLLILLQLLLTILLLI